MLTLFSSVLTTAQKQNIEKHPTYTEISFVLFCSVCFATFEFCAYSVYAVPKISPVALVFTKVDILIKNISALLCGWHMY